MNAVRRNPTRAVGRPVAVTGIGALSPFGTGLEALVQGLFAGRTALARCPDLPGGMAGEVPGFGPGRRPGRARRLALAAAREALVQAQLPEKALARAGMCLGTIVGEAGNGLAAQEPGVSPGRRDALLAAWEWGTLARRVARRLGLGGAVIPISTACASGADALGLAALEVVTGRAPAMVAGGVEVLSPFQWEGFRRLGAMDPDGVHPFDAGRGGTGLGEGACFWVLEDEERARRRGAAVLGRLTGWGTAADAVSLASPDPAGRGLARAAAAALAVAGVDPGDLAFVLAHATGTPANDRAEAASLHALLGERACTLPLTALKGATGHCLGASAALEAAAALAFLRQAAIPPVVGLREPDPSLGLAPARGNPVSIPPGPALALASGFGGQNAALVLEATP